MLPPSPFTRPEALDSGIRTREWRSLSARGLIREAVPGFFVDANLPDTLDLRLAIVRRAIPEDAIVARRSAAWLHGLDLLDYRGFPVTPRIETATRERDRRTRNQLMHAHMTDDLLAGDITVIDGIQVTTPLRTACDLARFTPRQDAVVALDAYLHRGLIDREAVQKHLVRWKKRRGVRQAHTALEMADSRSESGGESRMRLRLLDMGLPRPELQIPVYDMFGTIKFWLDLGWPWWMVALEYDGEEFHPEERRAHDEARRTWISDRGWTVRAFRREDIFTRSGHFEEEVSALLGPRAWQGVAGRPLGA